MRTIDRVLHPESHPSEDTANRATDGQDAALSHDIIKDNIAFNTHCFWPGSMRQSVHAKKLLKANGIGKTPSPKNAQEDPVIALILQQLDIAPSPPWSTKERATMVKHLRSAIQDDAEKVDNENRDTMMRMAGYWRYVNRKTYNYMVRHNQIWDWVTGQKLEEVEEEEESEQDTEDDRETDAASWGEDSTVGTPLSGTGTSLEDYSEDYDLDELKTLTLKDNTAALDEKLNKQIQEQQGDVGDQVQTPTASQFTVETPESNTRIQGVKGTKPGTPSLRFPREKKDTRHLRSPSLKSDTPSPVYPPSQKDTRHLRPRTIATLSAEVPSIKLFPPVDASGSSAPQTKNKDKNAPLDLHDDPNNRYNSLKNVESNSILINQRRVGANKTMKLMPAAALPFQDTTNTWATVKGKGVSPGKATYAAALKKSNS